MSHDQDWKTIVIHKPKNEVRQGQGPTIVYTKEVDIENNRITKVPKQLRSAIVQARNEKSLTRDDLAKKVCVPIKLISDVESGKAMKKEATQLALKMEKILKVKIL